MEAQKIINLLYDSSNEESKFATKKCHVIDSQTAKGKCKQSNTIKFKTETIKSSLCDYSDAFILVTGNITVNAANDTDVAFKNWAPFSTRKTVIHDVFVDWADTIWSNIAIIIQIHQEVYGSLKEMKFLLIMLIWLLIILNHLKAKQLL